VHDGFHQTNHTRIVDLNAGNSCVAMCPFGKGAQGANFSVGG